MKIVAPESTIPTCSALLLFLREYKRLPREKLLRGQFRGLHCPVVYRDVRTAFVHRHNSGTA